MIMSNEGLAGSGPGQCQAFKDDGSICLAPATILDTERGCYVCEAHKPNPMTKAQHDAHPYGRWTARVEVTNMFCVRAEVNGEISISLHPANWSNLSHDQALNLAAWLYVKADPHGTEFLKLVNAIRGK